MHERLLETGDQTNINTNIVFCFKFNLADMCCSLYIYNVQYFGLTKILIIMLKKIYSRCLDNFSPGRSIWDIGYLVNTDWLFSYLIALLILFMLCPTTNFNG